jgi:hypothetical protein
MSERAWRQTDKIAVHLVEVEYNLMALQLHLRFPIHGVFHPESHGIIMHHDHAAIANAELTHCQYEVACLRSNSTYLFEPAPETLLILCHDLLSQFLADGEGVVGNTEPGACRTFIHYFGEAGNEITVKRSQA